MSCQLPFELWIKIFYLSAYVHWEFDIPPLGAFDFAAAYPAKSSDDYDTSIQTKLSINLVSKRWNSLSKDLLYSHIIMRSEPKIFALAELLEASQKNGLGYGWWTRKLEFKREEMPKGRQEFSDDIRAICRILAQCPRLTHFTDSHTFQNERKNDILRTLVETSGESLRDISWLYGGPHIYDLGLLQYEGLKIQNLQLDTTLTMLNHGSPFEPDSLCLPYLRTLNVCITPYAISTIKRITRWELPSLQSLIVRFQNNAFIHPQLTPCLATLLQSHGPNLKSLEIYSDLDDLFALELDTLLRGCPNLQDLVMDLHTIKPFILDPQRSIQSLQRVGFTGVEAPVFARKLDLLAVHACNFSGPSFPAVRNIRLLDMEAGGTVNLSTGDTLSPAWWEQWQDMCESAGIRLEDKFGGKIRISLVEASTKYMGRIAFSQLLVAEQ
jgi:hypothetical protein